MVQIAHHKPLNNKGQHQKFDQKSSTPPLHSTSIHLKRFYCIISCMLVFLAVHTRNNKNKPLFRFCLFCYLKIIAKHNQFVEPICPHTFSLTRSLNFFSLLKFAKRKKFLLLNPKNLTLPLPVVTNITTDRNN